MPRSIGAKRHLVIVPIAGATICLLFAWVWNRKTSSLDYVTRTSLDAMFSGDINTLSKANLADEKEGFGKELLSATYTQILAPELKGVKREGQVTTYVGQNGCGYASVQVRLPNAYTTEVAVGACYTENGPKSQMLRQMLLTSWLLRYMKRQGYQPSRTDLFHAAQLGIHADRAKLESLGIMGMSADPPEGYMEWEQYVPHLRKKSIDNGFGVPSELQLVSN